jgi:hypothetical protein
VPYDHNEFVAMLEGEKGINVKPIYEAIKAACKQIGWPCFVRTDLASAKHQGPRAYLADNPASVERVICRTVEDSEMKLWLDAEPPQVFLVREFLTLGSSFTAFHGLPIAREWRFFADGERVICAHPYWPLEAFKKQKIEYKGWKTVLVDHHKRLIRFWNALRKMAIKAAGACGGEWSIDFAMDKAGKWFLIDMATAQDSWHWPGCPFGGNK